VADTVTDEAILSILEEVSPGRWKRLWALVDAVETAQSLWEIVPTTVLATATDGHGGETRELELGYVSYGPELLGLHKRLYALGLVVTPFDGAAWERREFKNGPPTVAGIRERSVSDAVRLLTVIMRTFHFDDGALASRWSDGSLPAVLARIRRDGRRSRAVRAKTRRRPAPHCSSSR
jgi:hypothetical protein